MPTRVLRAALLAALIAGLNACHNAAPPSTAATPVPPATPVAEDPAVGVDTTPVPSRELASEAASMFGDSAATAALADSAAASAPPADSALAPEWDIDVHSFETRKRVTFYIDRFQTEARPRFTIWLQRGGRYEPMIRAKLRAASLPEDLTYLALIESGYDPNAYSSAAAVGIWQFMASTARGTGLRVDWWIDERRDPVRSTDGAIRFLGWLHQQFGSFYLAAAAYDGGPGRVARGLSRYADELEGQSGDSAFFALAETDYLRAETRDYVPKLIAAAIVAKTPARYGFDVTLDPPLAYDSLRAGPALPLAAVASAAGVSLATVMELNNGILRGMTPPKGSWWVRVPPGLGDRADSVLHGMAKKERSAGRSIEVKKRATIATLSGKYGLTWRQLIWFNPSLKRYKSGWHVSAGEVLFIPTRAALAGARDVPDPSIERYGSSRRGTRTHVVRKGESLSGIAARYGTTAGALMRYNGLKKSVIYPGQVILVKPRASPKSKKPK